MKKLLPFLAFGLILTGTSNISQAAQGENKQQYEVMNSTTEVTAKVQKIDYKNKKITLFMDGETFDVDAGDEVTNLEKIKKGDMINIKYREALLFNINRGGKAEEPVVAGSVETGRPGEQPQAQVEREVSTRVEVTKIDKKKPSVTLKNAKGEIQTFKVQHPERLENLKVGDTVDISYSEAMAMKIEKQDKM